MAVDEVDYEEDAVNHQYNLVFSPWDAQFDDGYRKADGYERASAEVEARYDKALDHANGLNIDERGFSNEELKAWADRCMLAIREWAG